MIKFQPATRMWTCRACSKQYEYPLKGHTSTRYHCEDCATIPPDIRKLAERLTARIRQLETTLKRLDSTPKT